jgi:hypothetical protein
VKHFGKYYEKRIPERRELKEKERIFSEDTKTDTIL